MDRFVCPPWYQCRCTPGKPVSESTMLRHMREANVKRAHLGRGPFKRGPKLNVETVDVYDFGCEDSLEHHPTDVEDPGSSSRKRARRVGNTLSVNENHASPHRRRVSTAVNTAAMGSEDMSIPTGLGGSHPSLSRHTGDNDCDVLETDSDHQSGELQIHYGVEPPIEQPNNACHLRLNHHGQNSTLPTNLDHSHASDDVDWGDDLPMSNGEEEHHGQEIADIYAEMDSGFGSRIPGFSCWLGENIGFVELFHKHGLTHAAMDDILALIKAPCRSWKTVIAAITESSSVLVRDYLVCPGHMCFATPLGEAEVVHCSVCGKEKPSHQNSRADEQVSYIPLVPRFKSMFADETFSEQLISYRREQSTADDGMFRDFYDSDVYKDLCDLHGGPDEMKYDLFIAASTDGFQAFKNKSCDVWPLVSVLFNLAPDVRFLAKNVLPLMFIPNDTQPKDLQSFLIPFVNEILSTLQDGGIEARLPNGDAIRFRIHLIWFSADLAAFVKMAGITGHNGRFPCRFCLLEGYYSPPHQHYYYPTVLEPTQEGESTLRLYNPRHLIPRTPEHTEAVFARLDAARNITERKRIATETGVKGRSVLLSIPSFTAFRCFPPDIMHLFYNIGIELMRHHMSGLDEGFCVATTEIGFLDAELVRFAEGISGQLASKPRPLSCYTNWKAAEHKMFTLSYSLVVFNGYLDSECLDGLYLFVQLVDLCYRSSVTRSQAQEVHRLSIRFIEHFEAYYVKHDRQRVNFCKYVIHLLLHLGDAIREYGPLISASQFWVEKYIGWISGRSNARTLPAKSMLLSAWFGEAKRLYFQQPFHELKSDYQLLVDSGGCIFRGPKRKSTFEDVASSVNMVDMVASYFVRKHDGLHPSEARQFASVIEDVTLWSRVQFLCGSDTQTASSAHPVDRTLRSSDFTRPSCYVSTEMDATDQSVDVYYGKVLHFIEIKVDADHTN